MYLKSLTLKGFKSFADRIRLVLEPGITSIVGPNGSGKSNISDAVLWVLGERNARHLRGQSMEDVIFAGSSARRATSMAEVELVLDNSDQTLPVDFNEVVITRRIYRSGEGEYLINGAASRRLDVMDILHDTGLGVGTHSIISQGSIDSILASKPEDRRGLIEEAAGVLKHKQRLEKSARKLEKMENHIARASDVVNEVGRQLGPLERKAKRARRYAELAEELAFARLRLAVDDLRALQRQHEKAKLDVSVLADKLAEQKIAIDAADAENEALQRRIRSENEGIGEMSRRQRRIASSHDRLESAAALIRDRKRAALTRANEIKAALESDFAQVSRLEEDLSRAKLETERSRTSKNEADSKAEDIAIQLGKISAEAKALKAATGKLEGEVGKMSKELDSLKDERASNQESLANGLAHIKVLEGHISELELAVRRNSADAASAKEEAEALEDALNAMEEDERASRALVATCSKAKDAARCALDEANSAKQSIDAQIDALDELERKRAESFGQARVWIEDNKDSLSLEVYPLAKAIRVDPAYEGLVELLLGRDMESVLVKDGCGLKDLIERIREADAKGEVSLMLEEDPSRRSFKDRADAVKSQGFGRALIDAIEYDRAYEGAISALLGDVVVCDSIEEALDAHAEDEGDLRFVAEDGSVVFPSGKVVIGQSAADEGLSTLARLRHLDALKASLEDAKACSESARLEFESADESLRNAQAESLKLSEKLAELRGNVLSAKNLAKGSLEKLASSKRELEEAQARRHEVEASVAQARPNVEKLGTQISELREGLQEAEERLRISREELATCQEHASSLASELNEAKLEAAKAAERKAYSEMVVKRHVEDIRQAAHRARESEAQLRAKQLSSARLESLFSAFDSIAASAKSLERKLEDAASEAQDSTSHLHAMADELRRKSLRSHSEYDEVSQRLSDAKIDLARVEMQVKSSVDEIVNVCKTPLESALSLPELERRDVLEDEAARLDRRIANLGTINPDAAEEYDELKRRHDFLKGQLEDISQAKGALRRINRIIEGRMRDDFTDTFNKINENFQEVFSLLFPGGRAHLSLDNPDDLENAGVEVNVQPRGKRISKMSLMSGGEKSLTALALLFALYRTRPTPFYILDEVEAALDDTNLRRLISFIDELRNTTQLIMITHQRRTMEMADVLFGVSMQADGVTKVVSQKLDRAPRYDG